MPRVLILSDIHANPWALRAVAQDAGAIDQVLCIGDSVNYGPAPREVIVWLREHQAIAVCGNHDHAVAHGADPKASPAKQPLALAMRDWTRSCLGVDDLAWLMSLPRQSAWNEPGTRFLLVHGTPADALYDYRLTPQVSQQLLDEMLAGMDADVLLLGHTHLPMVRRSGRLRVVNPGSVGQPLDGDPRAAYALWEDGQMELRRVAYDQKPLVEALRALPLASWVVDELAETLRCGSIGRPIPEAVALPATSATAGGER